MNDNPKTLPGVHLLFRRFNDDLKENEYLLHKRINTKYMDDHFSLPGGHIDGFETPEECVAREAMEELRVVVRPEDIQFVNLIYRIKKPKNEIRTDLCFIINNWEGEFKIGEPEKHSEPKWYPVSKLPSPVVPYVEKAIKDIENGVILTGADV